MEYKKPHLPSVPAALCSVYGMLVCCSLPKIAFWKSWKHGHEFWHHEQDQHVLQKWILSCYWYLRLRFQFPNCNMNRGQLIFIGKFLSNQTQSLYVCNFLKCSRNWSCARCQSWFSHVMNENNWLICSCFGKNFNAGFSLETIWNLSNSAQWLPPLVLITSTVWMEVIVRLGAVSAVEPALLLEIFGFFNKLRQQTIWIQQASSYCKTKSSISLGTNAAVRHI